MPISTCRRSSNQRCFRRGGALLAVLWLSAALSVIVFSVANTVRGELERSSTLADSIRARYLATGAIEGTILRIQWGPRQPTPDQQSTVAYPNAPIQFFNFSTGQAVVEVIPETSKLNINTATPAQLLGVLAALGVDPVQAQTIVQGITALRSGANGAAGPILGGPPTFSVRRASLEEIEEVLLVPAMTPEIFYGTYRAAQDGRLVRVDGFRDCVSIYGALKGFDANYASPALMLASGLPEQNVAQIVARRSVQPFRNVGELGGLGGGILGVGGNTIYTLRATARLAVAGGGFSDLRRTVAATVKFLRDDYVRPYDVLRWYDEATSEVARWQ